MAAYHHPWCIFFSIILLLSGIFQNVEVNVAVRTNVYQKSSSSSMVAHALFMNEPFIYRGKTMTMDTNFTITLRCVLFVVRKRGR